MRAAETEDGGVWPERMGRWTDPAMLLFPRTDCQGWGQIVDELPWRELGDCGGRTSS